MKKAISKKKLREISEILAQTKTIIELGSYNNDDELDQATEAYYEIRDLFKQIEKRSKLLLELNSSCRAEALADSELNKKQTLFTAKVIFSNSYYGEDSGMSEYDLLAYSQAALDQKIRELKSEKLYSRKGDFDLSYKSTTLYKIEYGDGRVSYN